MQVWNMLHTAHWKYRMRKWCKKSPSEHHPTTLSGCIFATEPCIDNRKKNLLNSNMSSTCLHNMVNFGPLTAEIRSVVWGTPANFNWFRVLPSLLQRHHSLEANQTLHDIWPSPGLVHYIYIFGVSCPLTEFWQVQNSHYVQSLAFAYIGSVSQALLHRTRNGIMELLQRCHLYSAGRPSRWALAHILVKYSVC